jgi:hypothetical protein
VLQQLQIGYRWVENGIQKLTVHSLTTSWLSLFNLSLLQGLLLDSFSTEYFSTFRLSTPFTFGCLI